MPQYSHTVDGRNPAPVDRWLIPLFTGFQPSKVMQDFFHPQYVRVNELTMARVDVPASDKFNRSHLCHVLNDMAMDQYLLIPFLVG
jgi:hypothetical protein